VGSAEGFWTDYPLGGVRNSGYGREMGFEAMREYTEAKSVWVNVDAKLPAWYPRA
jgi:acyl-CoA reductase-like NAD-dependent aldehyde dehydrogenase